MADHRVSEESVRPDRRGLARRSMLPWVLFILALALAAWALWRASAPEEKPRDPLATALVAFEKQNRLTVFSAQLSPVVASDESSFLGLMKSRQVAVIPARIDYMLDLSARDRNRLSWDGEAQRLDVRLPPLQLSRPSLDEGRARYMREGALIAATTRDRLSRAITRLAEQQAGQAATDPVLLDLARAAAKDVIRQNLAIPLDVAGFGKVSVTVRFDGEPYQPQAK